MSDIPVFAAAPAAAAEPKIACPAEGRPDRVAAAVAARMCGGRVEVTGELNETTQMWAEPDGSFSARQSLGVARFQREGRWVDVDLGLVRNTDGSVTPKAHPKGLRLSGAVADAGAHDLVSLGADGERTALRWTGRLPQPVLEDTKATYADVYPGVDLVVEATRSGFEQLLVVKNASAVESVKTVKMGLTLSGPQATRDDSGGMLLKDAAGQVVARTPAPVMWDAAKDPLTKEPTQVRQVGLGLGAQPRSVGGAQDLTLTPDVAWLSDPARQFPITIDPVFEYLTPGFDSYVQSDIGYDVSSSTELRIGTQNSGSTVAQTYLMFSAAGLGGMQIRSAVLKLFQTSSGTCDPAGWSVWRTDRLIDANIRWSNRPPMLEHMGASAETACGMGWVGIEAKGVWQDAANRWWDQFTIGVRSAYEDTNLHYKTFKSADSATLPFVDLNFDERPQISGVSIAPTTGGCVIGANRPYASSRTPRLSATPSDTDSEASNVAFQWWHTGGSMIGEQRVTGVPYGSAASVDIPTGALSEGGTYSVRAIAFSPSELLWSDWTPFCEFTVDTTKPGAPLVSTKDNKYPKASADNTWGRGGYGQAGLFTLAPAGGTGDLASFVYQMDTDKTPTTVTATAATDVTITPSEDGVRTLTVWAKDKAGNQSDPAVYVFNVGRAGLSQPIPGANVVKRTKLAIDGDSAYTRVRFQYRRGPGGVEQDIPLGNLTTAAGGAVAGTTGTPVAISGLGGNAVWNAVDTLGQTGGVAQVRARMYKGTGFSANLEIRGIARDRCLTPYAWATANNTDIQLFDCTGSPNQRFELMPDGTIRNTASGRCLTPYAWATANNTQIQLYDCVGSPNQRFELTPEGTIRNTASGRCLTPYAWATANNTPIQIYDCNGSERQKFVQLANGTISNPFSGRCLTPYAWATANNTDIQLYDCTASPNQRFELMPDGTIRNTASGRCLTPYAWETANNTPIQIYDCNGSDHQKFVRQADGTIRGQASGRCLTPYAWADANNTPIQIYDCIGSPHQQFQDIEAAYNTQWITINVDPNGDGAASASAGPGSVNLLTGDHTLTATDIDEFGMSVQRTASSRETADGWLPQGERLTANQQQISVDTTGISPDAVSQIARVTDRGQGSSTDSLRVIPAATRPGWVTEDDTFAQIGGYDMSLGLKAGKRYRLKGWIFVPEATGLDPTYGRGLRLTAHAHTTAGAWTDALSAKAAWTGGWQELSVDITIPTGADMVFLRLYNGFGFGSGKQVFFDNLSLRELVAPFGPQWHGGVADPVTGNEYTTLEFPSADLAAVNLATAGAKITFGKSVSGSFFPQPGAETLTLSKIDDNTYRLTEMDGTVVEFTKPAGANAFTVTSSWTTQASTTSRYVYDTTDNRTLLKKVISPTEPGVGDCTLATPAKGCEVLEYDYAPATTATSSVFGDFKDQVRAVRIWSSDPAAAGTVTSVEVARYKYDNLGRLREVSDPRTTPALATAYEYGSNGQVTKLTPAGQLPWMFDYGTISTDTNPGWLHRVRRASLVQGSKTATGPENATRVVYKVPTTRAAGGPYNMDAASVATWAQSDVPTDVTAIFGPEDDPLTASASASVPGADGYKYATVHYLNANGQEVNTATPAAAGISAGNIDSKQYDRYGNEIWSLEATNRLLALGSHPQAGDILPKLGLSGLDTASRARQLASESVYSYDGKDVVSATGPIVTAVLEAAHGASPAGATVAGRSRTLYTYDDGKPDGADYHLVTTERTGLVVGANPVLADERVTKTGYDPINGSHSGWVLRKSTQVTTDAGTGGANLSAYTVYDTAGRVLKSWGIGSTGTDAAAKQTIYYTATANPDDAACGNRPEWAGQPCVTKSIGAITGHDAAKMPGTLPVRRVTSYNRYGDAAVVTETNAGKTRTTTTTFDGAGRVSTVEITSDDGTVPVAKTTTVYDGASGQAIQTTAATMSTSREYDLLGRVVKYTDADSGVTTSEYDRYGRPARTLDLTGTITYGYDRAVEPRGMLTTLSDNNAGTFTAGYSADGQLTTVGYPGGITRTDTLDANLQPMQRQYKRDSDASVLYSETIEENAHGQWAKHTYTGGTKTFTYDRTGRLTKVSHVTATNQCTIRGYEFTGTAGARTNRTAKNTWLPGSGGACDQNGTADQTITYTYDTADRLVSDSTGAYTYDAYGRTTALPSALPGGQLGVLATTFHANDMIASQTLGDNRQTWTLDPAMRLRAFTTQTRTAGVWGNPLTKINHYDGDSDSPKWINEAGGNWTRMVEAPDGDLAITASQAGVKTLNATNLHGDVAFTLDLTTPGTEPQAYYDYDEYGNPTGTNPGRYGWLGAKQRSNETLGGITLMGVRLYTPTLGRFLSVDPVDGGSCNPYDYSCADPVNETDLDGKSLWSKIKKAAAAVAPIASFAAMIPGPIGSAAALVSAGAYALSGNYKQAAIMAGGAALALAGVGAAVVVYRAKKIVAAARSTSGMDGGIRATRLTSWAAGKMWVGRGAAKKPTDAGGVRWFSADKLRQHRRPEYKGPQHGWQSNFESRPGTKGKFVNNYHVYHRKPKKWAPWW